MDLATQYSLLHEKGYFPGQQVKRYVVEIGNVINETNSKTLLDYGSGKARQYLVDATHLEWGVPIPVCYDPYYKPYSVKPLGKFDGVICTDVLEHVPESELDAVIKEIFNYADKFVFLVICTREAKKTLPDGRNAHLTVRPEEWWSAKIEKHRRTGTSTIILYNQE